MDRNRSMSPSFLSVPGSSSRLNSNRLSPRNHRSALEPSDPSAFYDFSALPLTTQRFDLDSTEEKFLSTKEKINSHKNSLTDCKRCSELLKFLEDLEEIANSYSRNRVKLLNSFFELYISLQEEVRKNKDLYLKYQKLMQEIDGNLEGLTERKINNKLKSLKNEIKNKNLVIAEMTEKVTALEKVNEFKVKTEVASSASKEMLEKEKVIYNLHQIIKEKLPGVVLNPAGQCKECRKKQNEMDLVQMENGKLKEVISKLSSSKGGVKDVKNPVVKSMVELKDLVVSWWQLKQDSSTQVWMREGEDLIQNLVYCINMMVESKVEQTGRELRSAVHKKICEIEADFLDLGVQDEKVKNIMEKFLELPYLLKPLFDLLKEYEKKELIR